MKDMTFNRTRLAASISMLLGAGIAPYSFAQDAEVEVPEVAEAASGGVEIIQVRGIRGSLARSMDMKREGTGVVDAISAEEMGKMPDTNLAESLQRIAGVSVSRQNGEGSQITVRGFGPSFNLVTLNGRQMPGTGNSRSYDLQDLSSAGVSALEVYKTARAEFPSGGIGATVNIVTTKPLNSPGLKYSVTGKGMFDTSNVEDNDITPELAALYSNTFADNTIGFAISLAHQGRDFREQSANIPGWQANQGLGGATGLDAIDRRPVGADGERTGNTFFPREVGYRINDVQRTRTNGQATLQYAPTDAMTFSLDYTRTQAETATEGRGFGVWFNYGGNITNYELDENGTAVNFTETANDYAHAVSANTRLVEAESIGFNFDWQATDDIHIEFDYHDSSNGDDVGGDAGTGYASNLIVAPNNILTKNYDYRTGEIPSFAMTWPGGVAEANPNDFDPLFGQFSKGEGESTVKQYQFDSEWVNPNHGFLSNIKFGVASTEQSFSFSSVGSGNVGPGGYFGNQAVFPDSMFTRQNTGDLLDAFDGGGSDLATNYYYEYDLAEALARMTNALDSFPADPFSTPLAARSSGQVTEETTSVYLQTALYFDIADMPIDINIGARYETTDVDSDVAQPLEQEVVWTNPTEWQLRFAPGNPVDFNSGGEHDVFLPSIDIKVGVTDEIVARMSLGRTITRAPLGNLLGARSLSLNPKPGSRIGAQGNANLLPFESTNFDFSAEYYYNDASFISIGYFRKEVENFITQVNTPVLVDGLNDPLIGQRALAAVSSLVTASGDPSFVPTDGAVWQQIIDSGGGSVDPVSGNPVVVQNSQDPTLEWTVNTPINGDTRTVEGIEFNLQHVFGESGFGAGVNFTLVDGDVDFDVDSFLQQQPLEGLGNSANFQVFYEKNGWSVRVTHAWRDEFLIAVGQAGGSAEGPPQFFKAFGQTDFGINYAVTDEFSVFVEGINITNETEQGFGRYEEQFLFARQFGPRYLIGARYTF